MNLHDELLLDAYLDGELTPAQARRLEAHLVLCPECQIVLQQRRALAAILQEAPAADPRKNTNRFAAEVNLRMARRGAPASSTRLPDLSWRLAPVGLLVMMVFIRAALWIAAVFQWIPGANQLLVDVPEAAWGAALSAPLDTMLGLVTPVTYWNMSGIAGLALLLLAALMYLAWLATWWASASRKNQN